MKKETEFVALLRKNNQTAFDQLLAVCAIAFCFYTQLRSAKHLAVQFFGRRSCMHWFQHSFVQGISNKAFHQLCSGINEQIILLFIIIV
jgi:hypothetical protein